LALLVAAVLAPSAVASQRVFCIVGPGDGIGWSWALESTTGPTRICEDRNVAGVSGTPFEVAVRFRDSINTSCSGNGTAQTLTSAEVSRECGVGFTSGLRIWSNATDFNLYVADSGTDAINDPSSCSPQVQPSAPCNFNPQISGSLPGGGGSTQAAIPALQPWHYVAIVMLIGIGGAVLAWRRLGG
jgi:hypothetical protein